MFGVRVRMGGVLLAFLSVWACLLVVLSLFSWLLLLLWFGVIYVFGVCYEHDSGFG